MIQSRFIFLLQTFDKKEIKSFKNYLLAFYPKMQRAIQLYGYLVKLHPAFPAEELTFENVISQAFGQATSKKNVQNSLSDLYLWARDFLICQRHIKDSLHKDLLWLDILSKRNLDHEYGLKAAQVEKKILNEEITDTWDHLERMSYYHHVWRQHTEQPHTPRTEWLQSASNHLEQFYLLSKMTYDTELLNRKSIFRETVDIQELEGLVEKSKVYDDHLLMKISRMLYEMVKDKREEAFYGLKVILFNAGEGLSFSSRSIVFQHLVNFTAAKIREQHEKFYGEAFELYDFALESGLLTNGQYISSNTFQNIVTIALRLGKTDWASAFVDRYQQHIIPKSRKLTTYYSRALIAFKKGDHHSDWFRKLQEIKFNNPFFAIRVKTLIIRSMYEAGEDRSVLLLFNNAFRKYLGRNKKIEGPIYESALNFCDSFRKLVVRRIYRQDFIDELKNIRHLIFGNWLLEQAGDLDIREIGQPA